MSEMSSDNAASYMPQSETYSYIDEIPSDSGVKHEFHDEENTESGETSVIIESEITVENENGLTHSTDYVRKVVKREKPDDDSSCSTSIDSESHSPLKRPAVLNDLPNKDPFLTEPNWDEDTEYDQGFHPNISGAKRRPNFTHGELDALVQHMDEVLQLQQMGATWLQLQEAWDQAAKHVNSVGHYRRSSREIKAKWRDLKSKVKCKATSRTSGRRNSCVTLSSLEKKVYAVLQKGKSMTITRAASNSPARFISRILHQTSLKQDEKPAAKVEVSVETNQADQEVFELKTTNCQGNNNISFMPNITTNNNIPTVNNVQPNSNSLSSEWQGWEAQTAERNAELLSRRATVPGQAAELAEISAEVAETGVWLATKRNEITEKRLLLEERRTVIFERLLEFLEGTGS